MKYKKIIKSILVSKLYVMIYQFDVRTVLKSIIKCVLIQLVLVILYTDSKLLYNCLVYYSRQDNSTFFF